MDKRKNSVEDDKSLYENYLLAKDRYSVENVTRKRVGEIFKEYELPYAWKYVNVFVESPMFEKLPNSSKNSRYKFNIKALSFDEFKRMLSIARKYYNEGAKKVKASHQPVIPTGKVLSTEEQEKHWVQELLKTGRFRIQELVEEPVVVIEKKWVDRTLPKQS